MAFARQCLCKISRLEDNLNSKKKSHKSKLIQEGKNLSEGKKTCEQDAADSKKSSGR